MKTTPTDGVMATASQGGLIYECEISSRATSSMPCHAAKSGRSRSGSRARLAWTACRPAARTTDRRRRESRRAASRRRCRSARRNRSTARRRSGRISSTARASVFVGVNQRLTTSRRATLTSTPRPRWRTRGNRWRRRRRSGRTRRTSRRASSKEPALTA